eukprot:Skav221809  [mRNA]  locus=scaffold2435:144245:147888:- [translate_table: standard]
MREIAVESAARVVDAVEQRGPLIRIVGDKFPGSVKKAIIQALHSLLMRGGTSEEPKVIGWALGMLLRRHLPTERAVEVFSQEAAVHVALMPVTPLDSPA